MSVVNPETQPPHQDRLVSQPSPSTETAASNGRGSASLSIWWIAIPLLAVALAVHFRSGSSAQSSPAIGKPAPRLDLVRLTDDPTLDRLDQVPAGGVTLIHFWGTWCGPCKMEYPHLAEMATRMQSAPRFRFVSVSCEAGPGETFDGLWKKTSDYFTSEGIAGAAFADPQGVTRRSAAQRLERNAMFFPTSILVGGDGNIVGVWEGYTPDAVDQIESQIGDQLSLTSAS